MAGRARPASRRAPGRHLLRSSALAAELVRAAEVRRPELVLDLGAGTGVLTAELARVRPTLSVAGRRLTRELSLTLSS